ncbi:hypothetical protein D3C79_904500 [compost metagenome]
MQRLLAHIVEDHLLFLAGFHPGDRGLDHQQVVVVFSWVLDEHRQQGGLWVGIGHHEFTAAGAGFFDDDH